MPMASSSGLRILLICMLPTDLSVFDYNGHPSVLTGVPAHSRPAVRSHECGLAGGSEHLPRGPHMHFLRSRENRAETKLI